MNKTNPASITSDGSTASYYELPSNATQLQDLISHRDMNAQIGEIFRACYRYGQASHSDKLRDAKKILYYAQAEIARLENLASTQIPKRYIAGLYWDTEVSDAHHGVLDTMTNLWHCGDNSIEGAESLADKLNIEHEQKIKTIYAHIKR